MRAYGALQGKEAVADGWPVGHIETRLIGYDEMAERAKRRDASDAPSRICRKKAPGTDLATVPDA